MSKTARELGLHVQKGVSCGRLPNTVTVDQRKVPGLFLRECRRGAWLSYYGLCPLAVQVRPESTPSWGWAEAATGQAMTQVESLAVTDHASIKRVLALTGNCTVGAASPFARWGHPHKETKRSNT